MDNDFATGYALGSDNGGGNRNGFLNGEGLWAIIIFAMIFGWGGNGFGWNRGTDAGLQGALTRSDLANEFAINDLQRSVAGVQNGICDGFYAVNTSLLQGFNAQERALSNLGYNLQQTMNQNNIANMQGFNGVDKGLCQLGYNVQQNANQTNLALMQGFNGVTQEVNALSQQAQSCCCETQRQMERGFCDTNYNLATNTTAIVQNAHNDADRVIAKLNDMETTRQAERIAALQAENQSLRFAANQTAQSAYLAATMDANKAELIRRLEAPTPIPAYSVPAPYPYGYSDGCGRCG